MDLVHNIRYHQRGISPKSSEPTYLQNSTVHCTTGHYITLHYGTSHYSTLHYTTVHYITVQYITLHTCIGLGAQNRMSPEGHKS